MLGTNLGSYRLEAEIGAGGMGRVFRAVVTRDGPGGPPGTAVALKLVHPHLLESDDFLPRFLREAEIGRSVRHANVVRTLDVGSARENGRTLRFLVMELVEGQTLRRLLEDLSVVPEELCRHIGREVAEGLAAIHAAGVVHRDLKPENVLLTPDHAVKIMDLGVARLADEALRLSRTGAFLGSPLYAAPEQFATVRDGVDGRADLFSLGILLYELASGAHPHPGDDLFEVLRRLREERPPPLAERNPQLSPFFEEVVNRLLEKDRDRRFPEAREVVRILAEGESSAWWRRRAREIRALTRRPLRRIRIPRETAVYGREAEVAKLRERFAEVRAGDGRVVLVEGEAGIGKTRLLDELLGTLAREGEDIHLLFGSYPPGGAATAAGAWATAYREHLGPEGIEEALAELLDGTGELVPAFAALLRGEPPPAGRSPLDRDAIHTLFVRVTRALAAERPTVVLIEDLHFAPEEGRALFADLSLAVPEHRILLVGTTRPGLPEEWKADLERLWHASRIDLARLGPKDLGRLLIDAFGSERLADELSLRIATKSDGNPYFVFEIIRGLRESGLVRPGPDGRWVSTERIVSIEIPSSVLDLIQARIADLDPEEQEILDVAACCGYEFDPILVGAVLSAPEVPILRRFGRIERAHRLVRSAGRRFRFDHHQVQEALYEGLPEPLRERYHAAIGGTLQARERASGREEPEGAVAVALADHLLLGGEGGQAMRYLGGALDHLADRGLNERAIGLAERALADSGLLAGEDRTRLLLRLAGRLDILGLRDRQEAALREAGELAGAAGDASLETEVRLARGVLLSRLARHDLARRELERARDLAGETGDLVARADAEGFLGNVDYAEGRYEAAERQFARWLELSRRAGHRRGEVRATGNLGLAAQALGRFGEARDRFERQLALARADGDLLAEGMATGNLGLLVLRGRRFEEARAQYELRLGLARAIGHRLGEANAAAGLGNALWCLGRFADARESMRRQLAISVEIGYRHGEAVARGNLGSSALALGRLTEAREQIEEYLRIAAEIAVPRLEGYALHGLGHVLEHAGSAGEARRRYGEALALREGIGDRPGCAATRVALGRLLLAEGRIEEARGHLEEGLAIARGFGLGDAVVLAACHLALLPGGRVEDALAALAAHGEALEHSVRMEARHLLFKATGDRDHLLLAHGILEDLLAGAPEEDRESMVEYVPLNRAIRHAFQEWGQA